MVAVVLVKMAVHPASQSLPMLRREVLPKAGKMWAWHASSGSPGRWMVPVWVDSMVVPSGRWTWMGLVAICLLVTGASMERKWPVEPVSAMAVGWDTRSGGEGPREGPVLWEVWFNLVGRTVVSVLGCPRSYGFGRFPVVVLVRCLGLKTVVLPPFMSAKEASLLWPSAGNLQVLLS
jgi:hypothetical protein